LDLHRDFCEIAVKDAGRIRRVGRIETTPEALAAFANTLRAEDAVVLEASGGAMRVARILRAGPVGRVVVVNAGEVRAISHARVKSDRIDAATLARLLDADLLGEVWVPDEATIALRRRIARRAALVRQRTRAKNEGHAVLMRCLLGRPPVSDFFGRKGRAWLAEQQLPEEEQETTESVLRQIDFLDHEIEALDRTITRQVLAWPAFKRLLTIPGVDVGTAAAVLAAVGDITRFAGPEQLVAYLGLDPKSRQSGSEPARGGHISKRGNPHARSVLVEAAWQALRTPGPLRAFGERIRARRNGQIAAVAVARKLAVLCWQLWSKDADYAYGRPSLTATKIRRLELLTGAEHHHPNPTQRSPRNPERRAAEQALQLQAELAYRRTIADWRSSLPKDGAGATTGRAPQTPS
jgi:transposase